MVICSNRNREKRRAWPASRRTKTCQTPCTKHSETSLEQKEADGIPRRRSAEKPTAPRCAFGKVDPRGPVRVSAGESKTQVRTWRRDAKSLEDHGRSSAISSQPRKPPSEVLTVFGIRVTCQISVTDKQPVLVPCIHQSWKFDEIGAILGTADTQPP